MKQEAQNINLRSEEIQEILGRVPHWITRYGSLFILFSLIMLVLIAGIVKYPDLVKGNVVLHASQPPVSLFAKQAGNLQEVNVSNNQFVKAGEVLAILENAANTQQVFSLEQKIDSFIQFPDSMNQIQFPENTQLGIIQASYANFFTSLEDYKLFESQNEGAGSIAHLEAQIAQLNNINAGLQKQSKNCSEEIKLLNNKYSADSDLFSKGIISKRELDESQAGYMQKKSNCESLNIQISNNQLKIQELKMQMFGFNIDDQQNVQSKYSLIRESANKLINEIKLWKESYLFIAPVDGQISLNQVWSKQQYVEANQELLTVVQVNNSIKVLAQIPTADIAKVALNQNATIRLEAYNFMEYGVIQGTISSIASLPRNNEYQVEITLMNGLTTTLNKELNFTQGMLGSVEIVSQKRSFLSRILDKFKYLLSKKYQ